ncbi:MAG: sigma-70 family RNA polymerase sigma factor [Sphingobacteriaceae bacterium]|nr:MAG: sigma-70 family RNA polymerase sigma factor [Sphingobacteriaceae bacterium]
MKQYTHYTDEELVALLKIHNRSAFNEIYNRYWKKMLLVAWNHSKDNFVAKDIVQEVFINLWEKHYNVDIQSLPAFLATAVKFCVFKHYQKEVRRNGLAEQNYVFNELSIDEEKLDARFLQEYIDGVVENMPERCRLVFKLSRNQGLKNIEIAEQINIAEKSVEKTLTRALKIIRCELKNYGILLIIAIKTCLFFFR